MTILAAWDVAVTAEHEAHTAQAEIPVMVGAVLAVVNLALFA